MPGTEGRPALHLVINQSGGIILAESSESSHPIFLQARFKILLRTVLFLEGFTYQWDKSITRTLCSKVTP